MNHKILGPLRMEAMVDALNKMGIESNYALARDMNQKGYYNCYVTKEVFDEKRD